MTLVYGTFNPAKLRTMREMLTGLDINLLSLTDLRMPIPDAPETGHIPLHNAKEKALHYYRHIRRPVFSCDSGLYLHEVPESEQPGTNIRRINGRRLDDEETISRFVALARQHGGRLTAHYKNAICLVIDEHTVISCESSDLDDRPFWIVDEPHSSREHGFPLDCLSVHIGKGKYYYDLPTAEWDSSEQPKSGFRRFFSNVISTYSPLTALRSP